MFNFIGGFFLFFVVLLFCCFVVLLFFVFCFLFFLLPSRPPLSPSFHHLNSSFDFIITLLFNIFLFFINQNLINQSL